MTTQDSNAAPQAVLPVAPTDLDSQTVDSVVNAVLSTARIPPPEEYRSARFAKWGVAADCFDQMKRHANHVLIQEAMSRVHQTSARAHTRDSDGHPGPSRYAEETPPPMAPDYMQDPAADTSSGPRDFGVGPSSSGSVVGLGNVDVQPSGGEAMPSQEEVPQIGHYELWVAPFAAVPWGGPARQVKLIYAPFGHVIWEGSLPGCFRDIKVDGHRPVWSSLGDTHWSRTTASPSMGTPRSSTHQVETDKNRPRSGAARPSKSQAELGAIGTIPPGWVKRFDKKLNVYRWEPSSTGAHHKSPSRLPPTEDGKDSKASLFR
ncbi:hypothetical protein B0T18DRAFT_463245 [Schizothecium vesticola]|uniref:Uncharacterized protein n=1 Tax=Schizothecium vesticola TaxID=314040 RepID=A0AA40K9C3_9PEZI|nr:hypothetical protein B0T18DRAFT_463245 [Schizothecium vesticola]